MSTASEFIGLLRREREFRISAELLILLGQIMMMAVAVPAAIILGVLLP